jgi:DNA-binding NarL/FixJ family response regulator
MSEPGGIPAFLSKLGIFATEERFGGGRVNVHVAVVDPLPMFQQGVGAVLSAAGYTVEEPADLLAWAGRVSTAVVLLTLELERDWRLLERLRGDKSRAIVIALVEEDGTARGVRAVRAGARSVLPRQVTVPVLRRTVDATLDGHAVLPAEVATTLAASSTAGADGRAALSEQQLHWLRSLAAGTTVSRLADDAGYSERAMYRMLQALYQQMGVNGRIQAIMQAQTFGWLR